PWPDTRLSPASLYHFLSPDGGGGPWKVVVPVPGRRDAAASQPLSLAAIGLYGWPLNLFSELRRLPDIRTVDPTPPALGESPTPTASPGSTAVPSASPIASPVASPTI